MKASGLSSAEIDRREDAMVAAQTAGYPLGQQDKVTSAEKGGRQTDTRVNMDHNEGLNQEDGGMSAPVSSFNAILVRLDSRLLL